MKKVLLLALLMSLNSYSQELFKVSEKGFTDYIVVKIDSLSKQDLFNKSINWIKETYNTPSEVIKSTIDNDKVIFEGVKKNGTFLKSLGMKVFLDFKYRIEISFKDGKYKFDPTSLQMYSSPNQYSAGGWANWNLDGTYYAVRKKNGKVKKMLRYYTQDIENCFNMLLLSHKSYLIKQEMKKVTKKEEDW